MKTEAQQRIIKVLRYEPYLTTSQVARLFYATRADGQPAKRQKLRPRPGDEYETTEGYFSAWQILDRMALKGDLVRLEAVDKRGRRDTRLEKLWALPGTHNPSRHSWEHETLCADTFVSLFLTRKLTGWSDRWDREELSTFARRHMKVFDRRFTLTTSNESILFDVLTGTEGYDQLIRKAKRLVKLAEIDPNFRVLYGVSPLARDDMDAYLMSILKIVIAPLNRGKQFAIANLDELLDDPLGDVLWTPRTIDNPSHRLSVL